MTTKKAVAVSAAIALALGVSTSASHAAMAKVQTVQVYISADTNIQDLWVKTLVPAFKAANPGYDVNVTFDLHGDHDAQETAKLTAAATLGKEAGCIVLNEQGEEDLFPTNGGMLIVHPIASTALFDIWVAALK